MAKMRYRLALDLGTASLGWAMVRLNEENEPNAVIKAGVRIFPTDEIQKMVRHWQSQDERRARCAEGGTDYSSVKRG